MREADAVETVCKFRGCLDLLIPEVKLPHVEVRRLVELHHAVVHDEHPMVRRDDHFNR